MRKKKWARPYIAERTDCVVAEPEGYRGRWKEALGVPILHLEIGSGKGAYWIGMSRMYPGEGWIALERSADAAAMGLKKCPEAQGNMRLIVGDAELIDQWFAPGELDFIHLNFSDPWPKRAHAKRRLSAEKFRDKYRLLLSDTGQLVLKTDNRQLYEFSLESFQTGFELAERDEDFRGRAHPEDQITEYEQEFIDAGQPIYRAVWRKGKDRSQ